MKKVGVIGDNQIAFKSVPLKQDVAVMSLTGEFPLRDRHHSGIPLRYRGGG